MLGSVLSFLSKGSPRVLHATDSTATLLWSLLEGKTTLTLKENKEEKVLEAYKGKEEPY